MDREFIQLRDAYRVIPKPPAGDGDPFGIDAGREQIQRILDAEPESLKADDFLGFVGYNTEPEHLLYLFPTLLRIWREECYADGWFVDYFHDDLIKFDFFSRYVPADLHPVTLQFLRSTLLNRITFEGRRRDQQTSDWDDWMSLLATYGLWTEDIEYVWKELWSVDCVGHAVALVRYISCFAFTAANHPIYPPWDPYKGGGTPGLGGYWTVNFEPGWKRKNVEFLRSVLSVDYLEAGLERCLPKLRSNEYHEVAVQVQKGLRANRDLAANRCRELIEHFTSPADDLRRHW